MDCVAFIALVTDRRSGLYDGVDLVGCNAQRDFKGQVSGAVATDTITTITLQPVGRLAGVVSFRDSGELVGGATVRLVDQSLNIQPTVEVATTTHEDGSYEFEDLISGHHYLLKVQYKHTNQTLTEAVGFRMHGLVVQANLQIDGQ